MALRLEPSTASRATLACAAMPHMSRPLLTLGSIPTVALDAFLEVVTYVEKIVTELQLQVACTVGGLCIMSSLLQDSAAGQDWGLHLALTVSISIACKLIFDEGVYVDDFRPMSDLYTTEILKAAERTAFERVLAMGGLSDIIKRLELFRALMLRTCGAAARTQHRPPRHARLHRP